MHAEWDADTHQDAGTAAGSIAVVGISALYPGVQGATGFWRLLTQETGTGAGIAQTAAGVSPGLADIDIDVARFGIPPAQAGSMARMQLLMLEAARQCLQDAGRPDRPLPYDRTDVVVGTCFGLDRQYANALRVASSRYARDLEQTLASAESPGPPETGGRAAEEFRSTVLRRLGASPHDRVGEMASTIPARVATAFGLRGRTLAVESADATSFLGIAHAVDSLRRGAAEAVLVLTGQCHEGRFATRALAAKGLIATEDPHTAASWPAADSNGFVLAEGVGALLLKRLSTAERDGDRVYASIQDLTLGQDSRPGVFRYPTSAARHREVAQAALNGTGKGACSVQYVECAGRGVALETDTYSELLDAGARPVAVGSVRDRLGHTFANAGLAAVSKVALALYHRRLPPRCSNESASKEAACLVGTPFRTVPRQEYWPRPPGGGRRRAAVSGASLTGTLAHLVLEEHGACGTEEYGTAVENSAEDGCRHRAGHSGRGAVRPRPADSESIAVVGFGGRFADAPDADAFWDVTLSGRDRIGPVPESLFDRRLYHSPGAMRLNHSYTDQGCPTAVPTKPPPQLRIPPWRFRGLDPAQRMGLVVAGELFARRGLPPGTLTGTGLVAVGSNLGLSQERALNAQLYPEIYEDAVRSLEALSRFSPQETESLLQLLRRGGGEAHGAVASPSALDGCLASGVATLIAHEYGLDAVPVAVEAACASSLAAVDMAVGRLRTGSADYALVGGVELPCNPRDMVLCSALGLLSHEGITPFDTEADGFTPGDGCGLFLLKRRRDALRDGDPIYGLLRGSGASNDAKSLIAPDTDGQAHAMRQAFSQVGFAPADVRYLEAHGTGTRVGDRVEVSAVAQVYANPQRELLEIGSAKSFFGHTFAAAGAAGLLRALQAVRTGTFPPNANLSSVNPELELARIPARVSTESVPWQERPGNPRRAAVSSFGTGGINYHLLIEEHRDGS